MYTEMWNLHALAHPCASHGNKTTTSIPTHIFLLPVTQTIPKEQCCTPPLTAYELGLTCTPRPLGTTLGMFSVMPPPVMWTTPLSPTCIKHGGMHVR